jgi:hypothetical protein
MDNINNILGIIAGIVAGAISIGSFVSTYYRRNCSDNLDNVVPPIRVVDLDDVVNNRDSFTTIVVENHHHKME